jgi:hypothetical protein
MAEEIKIPGGTFSEEDHIYKNDLGNRVLSVTQILQSVGIVDYSHISQEILERKSQIGIAFHKSVELLVQGILNWDTVAPEVMPYVIGVENWLNEQEFTVEEQEQQGICNFNGMSFGYRFDIRGVIKYKGRLRKVILDLKSCVSHSPSWQLQTAGYEIASPLLPDGEPYLRMALQATKEAEAKPFYYEDKTDKMAFLYALATAIWKMNHNIK